jgi:AcrR family transcriptional regulator
MSESESTGGRDTPEAIMEATYCALCEHGYADLTTQDIADESDTSTAALHYHYDTKEALLLAFLDHLYEAFTEEYAETPGDNAVERLVAFVDAVLREEDAESARAFQTALLEIRAQAPYTEGYRAKLDRFDSFVRERVETIVREGIDEGTVREDVDPADAAAFIATLIDGVNTRRVSVGETGGGTRRQFVAYVRDHLVAPDADVVVDPDADENGDTDGDVTEADDADAVDGSDAGGGDGNADGEQAPDEREGDG